MQLPNRNTPVERCLELSAFTVGALRTYGAMFEAPPELAAQLEALANTLEPSAAAMAAAQASYRTSVLAIIPHRVAVKLADLRSSDVVKSVKRAADDADPSISDAIFPGGTTPITKPFGQTEVDGLRRLEGRIAAVSAWTGRDAQGARIIAVRTVYETALKGRKEAMLAAGAQHALRDMAKEDFLDAFATVAATIKGVFPRDRARQDVFFDAVSARAEDRGDDTDTDEPVTPPVS